MFVPKIPLVAFFGEGKDRRTWHQKAVIAVDDEGTPWVIASDGRRALVPATTFSNYREVHAEGDDVHRAEIIPAHEGWRAVFVSECLNESIIDINILPIAAWKYDCGGLVPLVPHDMNYAISPDAETSVRGRARIDDARDDGELLLAIYGPGETIPAQDHLLKVAAEELAKHNEDHARERTARLKNAAEQSEEITPS